MGAESLPPGFMINSIRYGQELCGGHLGSMQPVSSVNYRIQLYSKPCVYKMLLHIITPSSACFAWGKVFPVPALVDLGCSVSFIETTEVNRSRELRCQNIVKVGIFKKAED